MRYANLYGISIELTGDEDRARGKCGLVKKEMHNLKLQNVNGLDHVWREATFEDGTRIRVESRFGKETATVYCEPPPPEKKVFERPDETWRFVPAICIRDFSEDQYLYMYYINLFDQGDVSVCSGMDWSGVWCRIVDSPYANDIGAKCDDFLGMDKWDVWACTNWANTDWGFVEDVVVDVNEDTDTGLDPLPYSMVQAGPNYGYPCVYELSTLGDLYAPVLGNVYCCPETESLMNLCNGGNWPSSVSPNFYAVKAAGGFYQWSDGYCANTQVYDGGSCCLENVRNTILVAAQRCASPLMAEVAAIAVQDTCETEFISPLWGCSGTIDCSSTQNQLFHKIVGSPQERTVASNIVKSWPMSSYGVWWPEDRLNRESGEVTFDHDFGWTYSMTRVGKMTAPCDTSETESYSDMEVYPTTLIGMCGGYIQDDAPSHHDKYFVIYLEDVSIWSETRSCSPWESGWYGDNNYGYDLNGVWDDGVLDPCQNTDSQSQENYFALCCEFMGERIEIDRCPAGQYFYCTDSHIFDALGTPVYMYAYVRYRTSPTNEAMYTRYGYFFGASDKHYQSEYFYPAGVIDRYGRTACHHDVFGSVDAKNQHGWGQCAGFMINEKTKETIEL